MPLPAAWVDSLFARLQARYGAAWLRVWEGTDIAAVKADWADELAGFAEHPEAIAHGLRHLPPDRPPTVGQFAQLCIRRADPPVPALPAPATDPAVVSAIKKALAPKTHDPKGWAHRLRKREQECDRLTAAQRAMWREAISGSNLSVAP